MPALGLGALRTAARLLLTPYLRDLTVLGARRIPSEGPVLLVGAAKDPLIGRLLLLAAGPRPARMTAKASRFRRALWSYLLRTAGFIPGASELTPDGRRELLARCEHVLVGGNLLALCLGEEQDAPEDTAEEVCAAALQRGLPLAVVPFSWTGLPTYPRRGKARLVFGAPFFPGTRGTSPVAPTSQELRGLLSEAAGRLDPQDPMWEELEWLERARPLAEGALEEGAVSLPPDGAPDGALPQRYQWARLSAPLKLRTALRSARAYFSLGDALGLRLPAERAEERAVPDRTYFKLMLAAGGLPAALYGWLFLALPFWAATWMGREWSAERRRPFGSAVMAALCLAAPIVGAFQAWLLWEVYGGGAALFLCAAALPACLWALPYAGIRKGFFAVLLALIRYRLPGRLPAALDDKKADLMSALEPVLWMYR